MIEMKSETSEMRIQYHDEELRGARIKVIGVGGGGGGGGAGLFYLVLWLLRRPWGWVVVLLGGIGYVALRWSGALQGDDSRALHGGQGTPGGGPDRDAPEVHFVGFVLDEVALFGAESTGAAVNAEELLRGGEPREHEPGDQQQCERGKTDCERGDLVGVHHPLRNRVRRYSSHAPIICSAIARYTSSRPFGSYHIAPK